MAKKDVKARDEDLRDDEDDDPDAGVPVAPAPPAARRAARARTAAGSSATARTVAGPSATARAATRAAAVKHDAHHGTTSGHDGHDGHDATEDEARDPSWWVPYAALGVLVLVGVLGFFGSFNRWLKPVVESVSPMPVSTAEPEAPAHVAPPQPAAPATAAPPPVLPADTFGAKHLLVMHKESRRAPPGVTRSKEEALARAKEALAKARAPGAKFEELVATYSDEPNAAQRGGNLGNFRRGAMVQEFQDGLEKTKVGEVSDIVETPFGYHVILRTR